MDNGLRLGHQLFGINKIYVGLVALTAWLRQLTQVIRESQLESAETDLHKTDLLRLIF